MSEPEVIHQFFGRLVGQQEFQFPPERGRMAAPKNRGVYIIKDAEGRVAHVGNTPRGARGLFGRLHNHLAGKSSFVRIYLKGDASQLRRGFTFQYLEVAEPRTRVLLESYVIGCLCPLHIGEGQLQETLVKTEECDIKSAALL